MEWTATPLATVSAPRGKSPPCVYRGFCRFGCSTNAKQSALDSLDSPRAGGGAEIRDLAMVGRIEMTRADSPAACTIPRGRMAVPESENVVVAGYAVETPRLLLMSACEKYPDGLANSSGLVGTISHDATKRGGVW